jgi:NAD(P)H-hydrate epimerase
MASMKKEKTVSVETMRRSDAWTIAHGVPSRELMYRAGEGIFEAAGWKPSVGIVCGKGNNAGDGFVAALCMKKAGIPCELLLVSDAFSEDGRYYFDRCVSAGIPYRAYDGSEALTGYGSLLDCLFGTGFSGDVRPPYDRVIRRINESGAYVVSADINSGLNGDTGEGTLFVRSDLTVSIGSYKHGHFRGLADQAMKAKVNVDIGIEIVE